MINLDERYHSYLHTDKCFNIDGSCEKVRAYGWNSEGDAIVGHYVTTSNFKLFYDMDGMFIRKENLVK
tara:strand:+ start:208 stop:411 length:204 start_codon:yes stop_codon:yes gene_type:complete